MNIIPCIIIIYNDTVDYYSVTHNILYSLNILREKIFTDFEDF